MPNLYRTGESQGIVAIMEMVYEDIRKDRRDAEASYVAGPHALDSMCRRDHAGPFGPGPKGLGLWAGPKGLGPLSQAQGARPFGPGPFGPAQTRHRGLESPNASSRFMEFGCLDANA